MKKLMLLFVLLSGCATISPYNQGCRDAVDMVTNAINTAGAAKETLHVHEEGRDLICNKMDSEYQTRRAQERPGTRH